MIYKSKNASVENVRKFFAKTSNDSVSLQEAFSAWGRDLQKPQENRAWLSNLMTHLKYHNLIQPVYTFKGGFRALDRLQLTLDGKKALGRLASDPDGGTVVGTVSYGENNPKTISDVMNIVSRLRKDNPDYEITFDVKLKSI